VVDLFGAGWRFPGYGYLYFLGYIAEMNKLGLFILLTVIIAFAFFAIQLFGAGVN